MQRRGFLGGLAGILAAGAAPAIVASPMKIWVPKPATLLNGLVIGRGMSEEIFFVDEAAFYTVPIYGPITVSRQSKQQPFGLPYRAQPYQVERAWHTLNLGVAPA